MRPAILLLLFILSQHICAQSSVPELKRSSDIGRARMGRGSITTAPRTVHEGTIAVNGTELYVKEVGEGELVIVIHGGPGLGFQYLLPHLEGVAHEKKLLFYDQRATRRSSIDLEPEQVTLQHFVEDIDALRKVYGADRIHLLSHSFGAVVAVKYAATYPEHVQSIVLVAPIPLSAAVGQKVGAAGAPTSSEADDRRRKQLLASEAFLEREPAAVEEVLLLGFKYTFHDTASIKQLDLDLQPGFPESHQLLTGLSTDLMAYDLHKELNSIEVPVLVVQGDADRMAAHASEAMQEAAPAITISTIERAGHFPFIEQRGEFDKIVQKFWNGVR